MILNDIVANYFVNQTMEIESSENKLVTPGELLVTDLLRGGVLYNLVSQSLKNIVQILNKSIFS